MTYFGFLAAFILFPIFVLTIVGIWEQRKGKSLTRFQNRNCDWDSYYSCPALYHALGQLPCRYRCLVLQPKAGKWNCPRLRAD